MISVEILNANEALKGLTDEQKLAIATLSEKDENEVIGRRFGEVYRQLDATIEANTGIARNGDEKTYNYLERATKGLKEKYADYDDIKAKVGTLTTELEEAKKNMDEASKAKIAGLEKELEGVRGQFTTLQTEKENLIKEHKSEMLGIRIDAEIEKAKEGIKFNQTFGEVALKALVGQAIAKVKGNNPTFEEREGKEVLIFKDAEGAPLLNAKNGSRPFTAKELLINEFTELGILEQKSNGGAGGKGGNGGGSNLLAGVSTQVEADEKIAKMLHEQGITKTNPKWNEKFYELRAQYKVGELPIQ